MTATTRSGQAGTRRSFLKASAAGFILGAWGMPVSVWGQAAAELDAYRTEFLQPEEWRFIRAAVARLIPSDGDGPGAIEALVPIFIDRQLAGRFGQASDWYMVGPHDADAPPELGWQTPLTPADVYRRAIPAFDTWCRATLGASFADLDPALQDKALTALADGETDLPSELRDFFDILLSNTKEGYFADPIYGGNQGMQAWVYIGFPGARANFKEWVLKYNVPYTLGPVSISGERA